MVTIKKDIRVVCVQHPNGDTWVTANDNIPAHYKILDEKVVTVEFQVELGIDKERAYPEGKIS